MKLVEHRDNTFPQMVKVITRNLEGDPVNTEEVELKESSDLTKLIREVSDYNRDHQDFGLTKHIIK